MNEILLELALRFSKVVLAALIGIVVYVVLVAILGVPGSPQLALESWLAGGLTILLLETSAF
jgi:hypothetical protein